MNTAVHGKTSLADMLVADSKAADTSAKKDRDKTNTVDFGATLTSLIDQAAPGKTIAHGEVSASSAASSADSSAAPSGGEDEAPNAPTNLDSSVARTDSRFAKLTITRKVEREQKIGSEPKTEASAPAPTEKVVSRTSSARRDSFAALLEGHLPANGADAVAQGSVAQEKIAKEEATLGPLDPKLTPSSEVKVKNATRKDNTGKDVSGKGVSGQDLSRPDVSRRDAAVVAATDVASGRPVVLSTDTSMPTPLDVAGILKSPVPQTDTTLDARKQPFSSVVTGAAGAVPSAETTSAADDFAKLANPAHIDAKDLQMSLTPRSMDPAHSRGGRANNGTSSALSSQSASQDHMNPTDPKSQPATLSTLGTDATASSALPGSQPQTNAIAQIASQPQRSRAAAHSKETSNQPNELAALPNDAGGSADAPPAAHVNEAAAIRMTPEVTSVRESSRAVNITVQLASGQTAHATVRERAGAVDVKILTPSEASAQRVSSEIDGMRHNLDAAGIKLGHSEISYQQGDGGRQGRGGYQPPAQKQSSTEKEFFTINEVLK